MSIKKIESTYTDLKGNILSPSSIMRMFDILQDENDEYFLNIFKTYNIDETIIADGTNLENVIVVIPWWENVAHTKYNDVDLWWLMCSVNKVINPFEEIEEGQTITILKKQFVPYVQRDMERIYNL